ncbi:MAG TPA: hypothetical protein VM223_15690, partial [Planctomycetota bacterium]|nr:hypothetical protein [Planctomycetota bacterium]
PGCAGDQVDRWRWISQIRCALAELYTMENKKSSQSFLRFAFPEYGNVKRREMEGNELRGSDRGLSAVTLSA